MFNKKGLKWIYRLIMMIPIVPIIWNAIYLNKYSGFDFSLRVNVILVLILLYLSLLMFGLYAIKVESKKGTFVFLTLSVIGLLLGGYGGYVNTRVYNSLTNMTMNESTVNYSLVTLSNRSFEKVKDLEGYKIGTLNMTKEEVSDNIDQFLEKNKLSDEAEVEKYNSPIAMLQDLYSEKIDAIIVGDNYATLFSGQSGFENIKEETKVLATIETVLKATEEDAKITNTSLIENPFSILLIGVDSTEQGLGAASLADSLIVATVNPKNLSVTMTSIPRDSYVEVPCFNNTKDKITHSNNGGTTCVMETVEKMFDLNIPYYVKINFKGVVELVDAIGGIYVDVPVTIEEQDSNRQFGEHLIKVEEGYQLLNGEQALALSRHRKTLAKGDLGRAEHQQLVIEGIVNQMLTEMDTVGEFLDLLDVLGNNIETNISMNQMTSGIQYLLGLLSGSTGLNPLEMIYIKSMVLSAEYGYLSNPYYSFKLSYAFPYKGAIADARKQMMINLGEQSPTIQPTFSFNGFKETPDGRWIKSYYDETMPFEEEDRSVSDLDQEDKDIEKVNSTTKEDAPVLNKVPSSSSHGGSNASSNKTDGTTDSGNVSNKPSAGGGNYPGPVTPDTSTPPTNEPTTGNGGESSTPVVPDETPVQPDDQPSLTPDQEQPSGSGETQGVLGVEGN